MIRISIVVFLTLAIIIGCWRRSWFVGACGAVTGMALLEHPDLPRSIGGIPGLNLWNILIANVILAWCIQRTAEGRLTMPLSFAAPLSLFIVVIVWSFMRSVINPTAYIHYTTAGIINEGLVNRLKFILPMLLFFDGCRSRRRIYLAIGSVVLLYLLLSVQVVKTMGFNRGIGGSELSRRAAKLLANNVGYHRVDMAMMLAGASWAMLACTSLVRTRLQKLCGVCAFAGTTLALALTGGRTGYAIWMIIGLILCGLKWRRYLLLLPVVAAAVLLFFPAARERMLMGFGGRDGSVVVDHDAQEITSGRTTVWPFVLKEISRRPFFGYGQFAYVRTGLAEDVAALYEDLGHPHSAYLEILLDSGIVGLLCILPFYLILVFRSFKLFLDRTDPIISASGGLSAVLLVALLIGSFGAQSLYVREGMVGMWAAVGIMMRVYVLSNEHNNSETLFDSTEDDEFLPDSIFVNSFK